MYVTLPLNLLAWLVLIVSKGKPRLVDVVDVWPDVLPFPPVFRRMLFPLFWLWKRLFVASVRSATVVLGVSNRFVEEAGRYLCGRPVPRRAFYIGHKSLARRGGRRDEMMTIVYIGNIGHVYDFDTLVGALSSSEFRNSVQLLVIGDGDRKKWLLSQLMGLGIRHEYFGSVYEEEVVGRILGRAHLGFNGYLKSGASFSYKAATYLSAGVPILNSMGGDLHGLVVARGLGVNYEAGEVESLRRALRECSAKALERMSAAAEAFAEAELEIGRQKRRMEKFLGQALGVAGSE